MQQDRNIWTLKVNFLLRPNDIWILDLRTPALCPRYARPTIMLFSCLTQVSVKSQWSLGEVSPHLARSVFLASLLSGARQVVEGVFDMMHLSSSGQGLGWWVTGTAVILRSVAVGINTTYTYCNPRGLVAVVNVQLGAYFVSRSGLQARKEGWGICPALPLNPRGSPTSVPH